ncbi:MAG: glutaredoxin domain-containing protein [Deinococcota bacterium]
MRNGDKPDITQIKVDDIGSVVSDASTSQTEPLETETLGLEVYGANHCRYTAELLEDLEWRGVAFTYYDVDEDAGAKARFIQLTENGRSIPVLVENGKVKSVGYQGRSCLL